MTPPQRGYFRRYFYKRDSSTSSHSGIYRRIRELAEPYTTRGPWLAFTVALALTANILAVSGLHAPFWGPAIGFWFLVLHPAYLLYTTDIWGRSGVIERAGYSITSVLLWLMLSGLIIDVTLPLLGLTHPLASLPITALADLATIALYLFRQRHPAIPDWSQWRRSLSPPDIRILTTAVFCPVLAVLGANRLNNGANDTVGLAALCVTAIALLMLLRWERKVSDVIVSVALYFSGLALLLGNSLRGWYVTGHDIQTEYRVFQLTAAHSRWSISALHSSYNACLSITILPTEINSIVHVDAPYIYKFFFQVLFALCPTLAYAISRRFAPKSIALLAGVFFIGFPTFFNDMPFLNRQEIAFLFVCTAILSVTNTVWPLRWRRIGLYVATAGIELSHYSTTYLFFGMLLISLLIEPSVRLVSKLVYRIRGLNGTPWPKAQRTIGLGSVMVVGLAILIWGGLATQTAGSLVTQLEASVLQITNPAASTSYSLLSRSHLSPQQALAKYELSELQQNVDSPPSMYIPAAIVEQYQTPIVQEPNLPLTSVGRALSSLGLPVSTMNTAVRQGAAKDEQLFVLVGFAGFAFSGMLRRRISLELLYIAFSGIITVAFFAALPSLSIYYGVLRAFQEALITAAPIMVIGSIITFSSFGIEWSARITTGITILFFISTIGLMPQILGGYPAQLGLNNSGSYYDIYYTHPQEVSAVNWLSRQPEVLPGGVQAPMGPGTADPFLFNTPSTVDGHQFVSDIYPALIKKSSWVILSYGIVHNGRAPIDISGNLYTYKYPISFLQANKNLVFNNGGSEIYR